MAKQLSQTEDQYMHQLGAICVNFQALEAIVNAFNVALIGCEPEVGTMIGAQLSFQRSCDLLQCLLAHRAPESPELVEASRLIKKALKLEEKRNTLFHSVYAKRGDSEDWHRIKVRARGRKGFNIDVSPVSDTTLAEVTNDLATVAEELLKIAHRMVSTGAIKGGLLFGLLDMTLE